jgi:6-phosphogluconolactonase/glucosamine-6-phosphate isomerase/deaminase
MSISEGLRKKRLLSATGEQKQETAKEILERKDNKDFHPGG